MNIIVTGGAGFLGSHLCETLVGEGHDVWCLDNLSTGRRENVEHLEGKGNFHFLKHDVRDPFGGGEVDRVYHLACPAAPKAYMEDPLGTIETCYKGTLNALKAGKRVLLASTSEVYGDPEEHPQRETYLGNVNTWGPRACYDEGKRIAETLCYLHRKSTEIRVARIFNTYGPRMESADGRVMPEFINHALRGEPLVVNGNGLQTRSFCYISDTVRGLVALMESKYDTPVNIGSPDEMCIINLVYAIGEILETEMKVVYADPLQDDPHRRRPHIGRARVQLGWHPLVDLKSGLIKTIEYYRAKLKTEVVA